MESGDLVLIDKMGLEKTVLIWRVFLYIVFLYRMLEQLKIPKFWSGLFKSVLIWKGVLMRVFLCGEWTVLLIKTSLITDFLSLLRPEECGICFEFL